MHFSLAGMHSSNLVRQDVLVSVVCVLVTQSLHRLIQLPQLLCLLYTGMGQQALALLIFLESNLFSCFKSELQQKSVRLKLKQIIFNTEIKLN